MVEFNFKSQKATTIEQSERLIALGLRKETADCCYYYYDGEYLIAFAEDAKYPSDIPAWSLHRLIEMCDVVIRVFKKRISLSSGEGFNAEETLYDNLINCIEWLINEGYFNKEYLNGTTED